MAAAKCDRDAAVVVAGRNAARAVGQSRCNRVCGLPPDCFPFFFPGWTPISAMRPVYGDVPGGTAGAGLFLPKWTPGWVPAAAHPGGVGSICAGFWGGWG